MLYPKNRNGGFVTTAIVTAVVVSGIAGGVLFFLFDTDTPEVDTVLKTDKAEIFGGLEDISESEEELILGGIAVDRDPSGSISDYYTLLGISPNATQEEIEEAWRQYRARFAGNSEALQIGRIAYDSISRSISDYYTLLGISPNATQEEIEEAWRQYRARFAGNSEALQIGRIAYDSISRSISDYYTLLGISPNATQEEIEEAWRQYRARFAGNSEALQIGRIAYDSIYGNNQNFVGIVGENNPGFDNVADFTPANPNPFIPNTERDVRFPGFQLPDVSIPTATLPPIDGGDGSDGDDSDDITNDSGGGDDSGDSDDTADDSGTPVISIGSGGPDIIEFDDGTKININDILGNLAVGAAVSVASCLFAGKLAGLIPGFEVKVSDGGNQAKECGLDTFAAITF